MHLEDFQDNMEVTKVKMAIAQVAFENQIDAMTRRLTVKLSEIFAPISERWNKDITPAIDKITGSFNRLSGNIEKIFGKISGKDSGAGKFIKILGEIVGVLLAFRFLRYIFSPIIAVFNWICGPKGILVRTVLLGIGKGLVALGTFLSGLPAIVLVAIAAISAFTLGMIFNIGGIRDKVFKLFASIGNVIGAFFNFIGRSLGTAWGQIKTTFNQVSGEIKANWNEFWDSVGKTVTDLWEGAKSIPGKISGWLSGVLTKINEGLAPVGTAWNNFWGGVGTFLTDLWEGAEGILAKIVTWLASVWTSIVNAIDTIIDGATGLPSYIPKFIQAGADFIMGMVDGIVSKAGDLLDAAVKAVKDAWEGMLDFLHIPHSPSGLGMEVGENVMAGIALGIKNGTTAAINAMTNAASQVMRAGNMTLQPGVMSAGKRVSAPAIYNSNSMANSRTYNLNMATMKSTNQVAYDFAIMEALAG